MNMSNIYGNNNDSFKEDDGKMTSFGVGREAFDKVVSPSKHNY